MRATSKNEHFTNKEMDLSPIIFLPYLPNYRKKRLSPLPSIIFHLPLIAMYTTQAEFNRMANSTGNLDYFLVAQLTQCRGTSRGSDAARLKSTTIGNTITIQSESAQTKV
jgi:hypothetical protein